MKLGLGTAQFGLPYGISNKTGQVAPDEVANILKLASASGMTVLDTAAGYGNAEEILGNCLASEYAFSIVTKTPPLKADEVRREDVNKVEIAFESSLRHLGHQSVFGLLVHHSADLLNPGGDRLYATLRRWKDEGRVRKIGVSVYAKDEVDQIFDQYALDLVQLPLNVFDQRFVYDGTLQRLHAGGVEVHVRSAFLQGLLLMRTEELPTYFTNLKPKHQAYLASLERAGVPPLAAALGYFHQLPSVSTVLIGVQTTKQLQECISAAAEVPALDFPSFAVDDALMLDPRVWR